MKHVVIGSGGREHAIGWQLLREDPGAELIFVPGNGGTGALGKNIALSAADIDAVVDFAGRASPDLVVVGPEDPLEMGMVDRLEACGITAFGPTADAARIESSKGYAKQLMARHAIPTAAFDLFASATEAHRYVDRASRSLVIKADGLAKGKGAIVTVSYTHLRAHET